jgi:hypothetical protein
MVGEYKLNALFIDRFTKFIKGDYYNTDPITIGIIGNKKVTEEFKIFFKNKQIQNHNIDVKQIEADKEISKANILFVQDLSKFTSNTILSNINPNALIISNESSISKNCATITFVKINNKLRFNINNDNAISHSLKISSYLLEMADTVINNRDVIQKAESGAEK